MFLIATDRPHLFRSFTKKMALRGGFVLRTPMEVTRFYCDKIDTGGVVLDCVGATESVEALCRDLRATYPDMPIAAIVSQSCSPELPIDMLLHDGEVQALCEQMMEFFRICGWQSAPLHTCGLSVGNTPSQVHYMGYRMQLSPREYVILRCLLYRMPRLITADELMSLCFPEERVGIANLTVQISNINRRAAAIDPRPLIVNVYGKGYRLRDGLE